MDLVNIHEAKTSLSKLLERVERGEEIVIARNNRPVARLVPFATVARAPGRLKGAIDIRDDFDAPLPDDVLATFEGSPGEGRAG